jgi:hypothetical protein
MIKDVIIHEMGPKKEGTTTLRETRYRTSAQMLPLRHLREQPVPQLDIVYHSKALISRSNVADFDLLRNCGHDRVMRLQLVRCDQT